MARKKRPSRLKHWFIPNRNNYYKPAFFSTASVACVLTVLVLLEGAYIASTRTDFFRTNFMASVLPGALVSLANDDRAAAGVGALTDDPLLDQAAQNKADDMAAKGYFSHVTPDGKQPWYWFDLVGYPYTYAGENLAVNFTDSKDVENAWMASPTHHANLVKPQYTQVGIGVAQGKYQGKEATFVVQFFAARSDAGKLAAAPPAAIAVAGSALGTSAQKPAQAPAVPAATSSIKTAAASGTAPTSSVAFATASGTATTAVLGAEVSPPAAAGFLGAIATSPTHDLVFILTALIILVAVLLIIAVVVKARVQYKEVIGGGLVLLVALLGLLLFTKSNAHPVQLPGDTQAAAVFTAVGH
ncbi:MAG TPA: CAP domain-containing protein [Candidatus Paceibacterota bacterium]